VFPDRLVGHRVVNARRPRGTIVSNQDASSQAEAQAMLQHLAATTALVPQEIPEGAETPPDGAVALPVVEQDGTQFVPVFTSQEALVSAGVNPDTAVAVPLVQLAAGWPDEELWLAVDPASENGVTLPPEVVRALPGLVGAGPNGTA
jgi:type III secretion system (T3SS) SseB-like protein